MAIIYTVSQKQPNYVRLSFCMILFTVLQSSIWTVFRWRGTMSKSHSAYFCDFTEMCLQVTILFYAVFEYAEQHPILHSSIKIVNCLLTYLLITCWLTGAPDTVRVRSLLSGWRLLPRHRRSPKKTALGWHLYASRQSDAHQLRRQSLQCIWPSRLEQSVDGPQTAGLVIQPFKIVAGDVYILVVEPKCIVNPCLSALAGNPHSCFLLIRHLSLCHCFILSLKPTCLQTLFLCPSPPQSASVWLISRTLDLIIGFPRLAVFIFMFYFLFYVSYLLRAADTVRLLIR